MPVYTSIEVYQLLMKKGGNLSDHKFTHKFINSFINDSTALPGCTPGLSAIRYHIAKRRYFTVVRIHFK